MTVNGGGVCACRNTVVSAAATLADVNDLFAA